MEYHERLGLSASRFAELREHFETRTFRGREYEYLPDYRSDLNRGVVLMEDTVVDGFPKVPRTLVVEEGVPRHFEDEIAIEEKLDGFNVRVARVAGDPAAEPLAFTRSGIVCPFTTYKARELLPVESFFADHPDLMLCGEMVGPENPYTTHDYSGVESLAFRVFDVRERETGESVPVPERRDLCEQYDIPQVPFHGVYVPEEAVETLPALVDDLDDAGGEGVVMKSLDVTQQLKYTTSAANQDDLAYAFSLPFDYGQPFMFRRIIREAFQSVEFAEDEQERRDRAHDLGESVLSPMIETIERIDDGETVGEEHTVRAPPRVVEQLFDHFDDMGLKLDVVEDRREDGDRVVTFRKITQSTNDKIRAYLDGQIVTE
ncbi:RNA ligase [Halorientalis brevis]|uniref:RNA ligase n=1 Tax=Halorientalis brevis TaxID=1126241 RepID=A0ABD6CBK2_9EURY|nr:RNA ligase [Halorientalis brevis]